MIPLRLAEIAAIVGGEVHGDPSRVVDGAAYLDTRNPVPGGLFVAMVGERVDGHDYASGAHAVLGSRPTEAPTVLVADPVAALGLLGRRIVDTLGVPVLALTGSQGKTSTKDLLAHVLAGDGPTVATAGNLNNELGVPLTVTRADASTRHLVVEMGARGIGHITQLCTTAPPRVAAVLNVGSAHVGEFGGVAAIAQAKGEIVEALPPADQGGTAVLNADDERVAAMASRTRARVVTFGHEADVRWRDVRTDDLGRASFDLGHDGSWATVRLTQTGAHHVGNAAAAAAMALASRPRARRRRGVAQHRRGELAVADGGHRARRRPPRRQRRLQRQPGVDGGGARRPRRPRSAPPGPHDRRARADARARGRPRAGPTAGWAPSRARRASTSSSPSARRRPASATPPGSTAPIRSSRRRAGRTRSTGCARMPGAATSSW